MRSLVVLAALWAAAPASAQSEESLHTFNRQIATTWSDIRPLIHEKLQAIPGSFVGRHVAGARVREAHLEFLDLDSPPIVDAFHPKLVSLRIPAGQWRIGIKLQLEYKNRLFKKRTNVHLSVRNLWIGLKVFLDDRDPERPRVTNVLSAFDYDLRVDASNTLLGPVASTFSGFLSSGVTKDIARIVLRQYLNDFVAGWPPAVHGKAIPVQRTAGTMDFEGAARRLRDRATSEQMPHDLVVDAVYENGSRKGFVRQADSTIYTGHWLAAQAVAYKVTRDPAAQQAAIRALEGIRRALALGSNPDALRGSTATIASLPSDRQGRLVRYAARSSDSIEAGKTYLQAFAEKTGSVVPLKLIDGVEWAGYPKEITRDQYVGVLQGLAWSLASLDDPRALALAREAASEIARFVLDGGWTVTDPAGKPTVSFLGQFPHQVALLVTANLANPGEFAGHLAAHGALAELIWFNAWIDTADPHGSYFKFDLMETSLSTLLQFDKSAARWPKYQYAQRILWKAVGHHQNPYFAAVAALALPEKANSLRPEIEETLKQWLSRPMDDGMPSDIVTERMYQNVVKRGWLKYEPKVGFSFGVGGEVQEEEGGFYSDSVIPIRDRVPRSYLWGRSPFHVGMPKPNSKTITHYSGTDFQLAYWMARHLGLVSPPPDRSVVPPVQVVKPPVAPKPVQVLPAPTLVTPGKGNFILRIDTKSITRRWKRFIRRY